MLVLPRNCKCAIPMMLYRVLCWTLRQRTFGIQLKPVKAPATFWITKNESVSIAPRRISAAHSLTGPASHPRESICGCFPFVSKNKKGVLQMLAITPPPRCCRSMLMQFISSVPRTFRNFHILYRVLKMIRTKHHPHKKRFKVKWQTKQVLINPKGVL